MAARTKATKSAAATDSVPRLLPISDTVNGNRARESPLWPLWIEAEQGPLTAGQRVPV